MNRNTLLDSFWLHFFVSIAIFIVTTLIRYESSSMDLWVTHIIYFTTVTLFTALSTKPAIVLRGFIIGFASIILVAFAVDGISLAFSLNIISYLLAIINGYMIVHYKGILIKALLVFTSIAYCTTSEFLLYDLVIHFENHGSFTGETDKAISNDLYYVNEHNDTVHVGAEHNKIYVLDFWNTTCGICFQEFPILEHLHNKYTSNDKVVLTSVNVPIKRDTDSSAVKAIRKKNYTFPVAKSINQLDSILNVNAFPVVIIIKNNKLLYRGDIKGVEDFIDKELSLLSKDIFPYVTANVKLTEQPKTKIEFDKHDFHFGQIVHGDIAECSFKFRNVGNQPLYINNVRSSCGCTIPEFPKKPILPNDSGKIDIRFNSKNRHGLNRKKIYVFSNTDSSGVTTLSFSVNVIDENIASRKG